MANTLLTIDMITREAVRLWRNNNSFLRMVDRQYDDSFARGDGAKNGDTLRIRYPNDYLVRTGPTASVQDTTETSTTLTLATQKGVDISFSTAQRTLKINDYSRRYLAPMVNNLVGEVARDVMSGAETGVANLVQNTTAGVLATPTIDTWLMAGAILTTMSARADNRTIVSDPFTNARVVGGLAGLLNPTSKISEQYRSGNMGTNSLGADWSQDQTVIKHTTGTFSAGGTVNGAGQTGLNLVVNAITGTLKAGDIIVVPGVNSVNRINKQSNGTLAQFVVTADVANGGTSIPIYPAIVPPSGGQAVQYQTVDASPANAAQVVLVTTAGATFRKNILFTPDAVTMVTADLELPRGVHEAARENYDGISLRMITAYNFQTDQMATRLDVLYGYLWLRPEWAVTIPDIV